MKTHAHEREIEKGDGVTPLFLTVVSLLFIHASVTHEEYKEK